MLEESRENRKGRKKREEGRGRMSKKEEGKGQERKGSHREAVGRGGMSRPQRQELTAGVRSRVPGSHLINSPLPHK